MIEEIRRLARQQKFRLTCHAAEEIAEEGIDEGIEPSSSDAEARHHGFTL
jgi:hypothetical protein